MPSLTDLAESEIASFNQVSDSLPTGVYEFDVIKPSDREEVGALKAVDKMLKNQRELLRQQKLRPVPSQALIARYEGEIELLLTKREALKKDKRMGGFAQ